MRTRKAGFFKVGDTIAVKFLSIGRKEYDFYTTYDNNVGSTGDIFSTPADGKGVSIDGGLGIWAGRGVYMDTVVCRWTRAAFRAIGGSIVAVVCSWVNSRPIAWAPPPNASNA